jgi:hypothetical protein
MVLGKQGLWPGRRWNGKKGTAQTIRACEAVQLDPLNIIARSQAEVKELLEGWIEAGKVSRVQMREDGILCKTSKNMIPRRSCHSLITIY